MKDEIKEYINENWTRIRTEIIERRYKPQPVLRVEIPKPNGGLRFTRYADDCLIFVGSRAAAIRVMHSVTRYIERKLGLKVNVEST